MSSDLADDAFIAELKSVLADFADAAIELPARSLRALLDRLEAAEWREKALRKAGRAVLVGLNARIDAAPATAKPVFSGIADLHAALEASQ